MSPGHIQQDPVKPKTEAPALVLFATIVFKAKVYIIHVEKAVTADA